LDVAADPQPLWVGAVQPMVSALVGLLLPRRPREAQEAAALAELSFSQVLASDAWCPDPARRKGRRPGEAQEGASVAELSRAPVVASDARWRPTGACRKVRPGPHEPGQEACRWSKGGASASAGASYAAMRRGEAPVQAAKHLPHSVFHQGPIAATSATLARRSKKVKRALILPTVLEESDDVRNRSFTWSHPEALEELVRRANRLHTNPPPGDAGGGSTGSYTADDLLRARAWSSDPLPCAEVNFFSEEEENLAEHITVESPVKSTPGSCFGNPLPALRLGLGCLNALLLPRCSDAGRRP